MKQETEDQEELIAAENLDKFASYAQTIEKLQEELAAMTEDRDLWRYDHEGDCPVQAKLEDEIEARKQAEDALRAIRLGLSECFSNIISGGAYDPAAIIQNTMKQIDAALAK